MNRHRSSRIIGALAVALAAIWVTACGSAQPSAGPLQALSAGGQPILAIASVVVVPRQAADTEAYVSSSARDLVRVTGVSAVAVPGVPAGRLVRAGVRSSGASVATARGWPAVPTRPLIGAELRGSQFGIVFGISGPRAGRDYAVAGLRIRYVYQGQSYSMVAWGALVGCVTATLRSDSPSCRPFASKVNGVVEKMAGI